MRWIGFGCGKVQSGCLGDTWWFSDMQIASGVWAILSSEASDSACCSDSDDPNFCCMRKIELFVYNQERFLKMLGLEALSGTLLVV